MISPWTSARFPSRSRLPPSFIFSKRRSCTTEIDESDPRLIYESYLAGKFAHALSSTHSSSAAAFVPFRRARTLAPGLEEEANPVNGQSSARLFVLLNLYLRKHKNAYKKDAFERCRIDLVDRGVCLAEHYSLKM